MLLRFLCLSSSLGSQKDRAKIDAIVGLHIAIIGARVLGEDTAAGPIDVGVLVWRCVDDGVQGLNTLFQTIF